MFYLDYLNINYFLLLSIFLFCEQETTYSLPVYVMESVIDLKWYNDTTEEPFLACVKNISARKSFGFYSNETKIPDMQTNDKSKSHTKSDLASIYFSVAGRVSKG